MRYFILICLLISFHSAFSQVWVDSSFAVQVTEDVFLDEFLEAGITWSSRYADIYLPVGDAPPACGRPVVLILHGGFFQFGSRKDTLCRKMANDFASRGYCAVSMDYRLGLFKPSDYRSCPSVDEWACLQALDTAEWYRAAFKAGQDVHATLRVLNDQNTSWNLNIDFRNVFLIGEDAGAMGCLSAGFRHELMEIRHPAYAQYAELDWPHPSYQTNCITANAAAPGPPADNRRWPLIAPYRDLPAWPPTQYQIKGIGSLNGAVFDDVFTHSDSTALPHPAIYFFHAPDNRMVPYYERPILEEYGVCANNLASCNPILTLPISKGPGWMISKFDALNLLGKPTPDTYLDTLSGNQPCNSPDFDPALHNHGVPDMHLRSLGMAQFFALRLDSTSGCSIGVDDQDVASVDWVIYPNPVGESFSIQGLERPGRVEWVDLRGRMVAAWDGVDNHVVLAVPGNLANGVYFARISGVGKKVVLDR